MILCGHNVDIKLKAMLVEMQSIDEGLIVTHPLNRTMESLETWYNFNNEIKYIKDGDTKFKVSINHITRDNLDILLVWINNMGYFPSHIYTKHDDFGRPYKPCDVEELVTKKTPFVLKFEAKYDNVLNGDVYKMLYHITDVSHKDKILKQGLCPKSQSNASYHPDRVYLAFKKYDALFFACSARSKIVNCVLFTVDLNKSPTIIQLYVDPNFKQMGCYTLDNINPICLKVVED